MTYLRNSWYCAGWSKDLGEKPLGIRICDEPLVLFRTSNGSVAALHDRCPHRFAPLSLGCVKGDVIECGYHGLQFDRSGTCTLNPHGRGVIPPRAVSKSYPVAERHQAIWVWMGDPAAADEDKIIDLSFMESEDWGGISAGYLKVSADYRLVIDNLLDLTHATFLHSATVGLSPEDSLGSGFDYDFRTEGFTVHSDYSFFNSATTPVFSSFFAPARGDIHANIRWEPASSLYLDVGITEVGQPLGSGLRQLSAHLIVPETADSCHYFYSVARNTELDDEEKTAFLGAMVVQAFVNEDEPMIAQCFRMMQGAELFDLDPAILETDIAAVQARRMLAKLIRLENEKSSEPAQIATE